MRITVDDTYSLEDNVRERLSLGAEQIRDCPGRLGSNVRRTRDVSHDGEENVDLKTMSGYGRRDVQRTRELSK